MRTRVSTVRPKKYSVTRSFRLSAEEAELVNAKFGGRTLSAVVRALLLDTEMPAPNKRSRVVVIIDPKVTMILAGVGNNMNQMAHRLHVAALRNERIPVARDLVVVERQLAEVERLLIIKATAANGALGSGG